MKSAADWTIQINEQCDKQGGFDSVGDFEHWIKQVQLDAWKQGMTDAAKIADSAKVREDSHNSKASVQVCIKWAIESARDKQKPLKTI